MKDDNNKKKLRKFLSFKEYNIQILRKNGFNDDF